MLLCEVLRNWVGFCLPQIETCMSTWKCSCGVLVSAHMLTTRGKMQVSEELGQQNPPDVTGFCQLNCVQTLPSKPPGLSV